MVSLTVAQLQEIIQATAIASIFGPFIAMLLFFGMAIALRDLKLWLDRRSFRALWREKYGDRVDGFEEAFWDYREGQPTSLM